MRPLYRIDALFVNAPQVMEPLPPLNVSGPFTAQDLRAMYQFAPAVADTSKLTNAQRALLGEGQTIYLVGAFHDPELPSYLSLFSARNNLPACATVSIGSDTPLPLPSPAPGCSISFVGADNGGNVAPLPAFDSSWAFEEALDVEMAHAAAPLARIVVVAAQTAGVDSILGAVTLANRMGNGVVSMSLGVVEHSVMEPYDALFKSPGMLYVAAAGDSGSGEGPLWPSVVPTVLSVGGTVATWDGRTRSETAWSSGGGGMSSTRTVPAFQRGYNLASTSGCVVPSGRMVPDVSLAASDLSAYLPGWAGTGDYVVGGTSASAPFWAGILATANAVRAQAGKAPLASAHQVLYDVVGQTHTSYAAGMYDVRAGENGSCSTCAATAGYDLATGLGTPNVNAVLGYFRDR